MTIHLIRKEFDGKAVRGTLALPFDENKPLIYPTLENADYLIPEGTYPLKLTWSPKFRKLMPEICDVPDRTGIRIHKGTVPEHSTGCVLTPADALMNLTVFINRINICYDNEQLFIAIEREQ